MKRNTLILTGKRVICVHVVDNEREPNTEPTYKHWNILYKDIMRIHINAYSSRLKRILSQEEVDRPVDDIEDDLTFLFKILYHQVDSRSLD